jgi:hypothetical protein
MIRNLCFAAIPVALCGLFAGAVLAGHSGVYDNARLFSSRTVQQAIQEIGDIQRYHHVNLLVETFPKLPWLARLVHNFKDPAVREKYFTDWAHRRARQAGSNGIYILICQDRGAFHVQVELGLAAQDQGLPIVDPNPLRLRLVDALALGKADSGLLEVVRLVDTTLLTRGGADGAPTASVLGMGVVTFPLTILVGIWLGGVVNRSFRGRRNDGSIDGASEVEGEGSYLATLFIASRGDWLADLATLALSRPPRPGEELREKETETYPPVEASDDYFRQERDEDSPYQNAGHSGSGHDY